MRLLLLCLITTLGACGCSQRFTDALEINQLAFFGDSGAQLSAVEINSLPYASIYAKLEGQPQAFIVLAFW